LRGAAAYVIVKW